MKLTDQLLTIADAYCLATRRSRTRVSTIILCDGTKLDAIARGRDLTTGRFEKAMQWFSAHWPDDAVWPDEIHRPDVVPVDDLYSHVRMRGRARDGEGS